MTKVYCVFVGDSARDYSLQQIFSTRELAEKWANNSPLASIQEVVVDGDSKPLKTYFRGHIDYYYDAEGSLELVTNISYSNPDEINVYYNNDPGTITRGAYVLCTWFNCEIGEEEALKRLQQYLDHALDTNIPEGTYTIEQFLNYNTPHGD